jgi:hypothetical protein
MGGGENHPRTWSLQGSEDGHHYVSLKDHHNDSSVKRHENGSWSLPDHNKFWRFLRIQNNGNPNHLCCSGIEFYGNLIGSKKKKDYIDELEMMRAKLKAAKLKAGQEEAEKEALQRKIDQIEAS